MVKYSSDWFITIWWFDHLNCNSKEKAFLVDDACVAMYSLWLTKKYKKNVSYVCSNCHHVFNPSVIHFVTASHTPKTRKLQCPDCHEMHYCVEIAKQ